MTTDTETERRSDTERRAETDAATPHTLRWQPQRLGLVDLFHYENEVFPFRDGRLLLRGNNGAGKSKVLALTLPFLLDGDISARRVEPDADPGKRMEWNLLLDGEHQHSERMGYSWLEFARVDDDGAIHHVTIGAGLKAVRGRGITRTWFFVTSQRVGIDLLLIDDNRITLSKDRLDEAIGDSGRIYETKRDYRRAVDEKLFGLGERRYDSLVDLLIQIRAPQLSKRPSEKLLSDALTESLTPVSDDLVKVVAEGMRGLDEEREQVQQLVDARKSVLGFLSHYRAYARVLVRRQAAGPRQTQAEYDRVGREIIDLTEQGTDAARQIAEASESLDQLGRERSTRQAEREALRDSEYVGLETQLRLADEAATAAGKRRDRAGSVLAEASRQQEAEELEAESASERYSSAAAAHSAALSALTEAASLALIQSDHADVSNESPQAALAIDREATSARIADARAALERVRDLLAALGTADSELARARQRLDAAESRRAEASAERTAADDAAESAAEKYTSDVELALARMTELGIEESAFEEFAQWTRSRAGESPARLALADAAHLLSSELHETSALIKARSTPLMAQREVLSDEIAALHRGESPVPRPVHTRSVVASDELALWQAVSFQGDVPEADRAGLEAALEASGLLTAVFTPDDGTGEMRDARSGEVLLRSAELGAGIDSLRDVLRVELPEGTAGIDVAAVDAVLGSIALADAGTDHSVWVSRTGMFRLGAAHGSWTKPEAEFVGSSARADAGARRLRAAISEREDVQSELDRLAADVAALAARLVTVVAESRSLPEPLELDRAVRASALAGSRFGDAETAVEETLRSIVTAEGARDAAARELEADAAVLGLPSDETRIVGLAAALNEYERRATEFWHAAELSILGAAARAVATDRLAAAEKATALATEENRDATTDATASAAAASALRALVGDDVAKYRERVRELTTSLETLNRDIRDIQGRLSDEQTRAAVLDERRRGTQQQLDRVADERRAAVTRLRSTARLGLVRVALPALVLPGAIPDEERAPAAASGPHRIDGAFDRDWTITEGVQLARQIEQDLTETDATDSRFERLKTQVHTELTTLQQSLGRHGHQASSTLGEDGFEILVTFGGRQTSLPDLAESLENEITAREQLLGAREREIIENHLVTEVGAHLSELVGDADRQIADVNSELNARPTTTGMKLRVRWKPRSDGPSGLTEARARLATPADAWDDDDRRALGGFLQERIAEVRESDETGNWYEHLGEALDYRRWHHFAVERYQAGVWKSATGPASGGERVLAASIPLFAAASSHYRTARNPHAPRLIMLDEAFAGVDDNARASCLGLLAHFDLDVVMTSEREWGCYAEVPGLSIAQLSRFDETPAVFVQLWTWDGATKNRVEPASSASVSSEDQIW